MGEDDLVTAVLGIALRIHRAVGPGLLESAYEAILADQLLRSGFKVERQKPIAVSFEHTIIDAGFRADLIINEKLLIELKSVERLMPIHGKQVLTYLRFTNLRLGLLINFNVPLLKEGIKRIINPDLRDRA